MRLGCGTLARGGAGEGRTREAVVGRGRLLQVLGPSGRSDRPGDWATAGRVMLPKKAFRTEERTSCRCRFWARLSPRLLLSAPALAMPSSLFFQHNGAPRVPTPIRASNADSHRPPPLAGKCAANMRQTTLDLDAPKELMGLDVLHKRSTARNVEAMNHGRFATAPRSAPPRPLPTAALPPCRPPWR